MTCVYTKEYEIITSLTKKTIASPHLFVSIVAQIVSLYTFSDKEYEESVKTLEVARQNWENDYSLYTKV